MINQDSVIVSFNKKKDSTKVSLSKEYKSNSLEVLFDNKCCSKKSSDSDEIIYDEVVYYDGGDVNGYGYA